MKSRQRVIDHGEVFTPPALVNDMLDLVAHECERLDSRFLEPACGDGNFLAEVLRRKLLTVDKKNARKPEKWARDAILAVCSLYGIDLLADNVAACRARLLEVVGSAYMARFKEAFPDKAGRSAAFVLERNIVQGDALSFRMADGRPIVLPEWSLVNRRIKRFDFQFEGLLEHAAYTETDSLFNELSKTVYKPTHVGEYPLCHYLKLPDMENGHDRP